MIQVNVAQHLVALKAAENAKPLNQQRRVPSITELAEAAHISRATFYNWAGNKYASTRHDILEATLNTLRGMGFATELTDLLREHPASTLPQPSGEDDQEEE